MDFKITEYKPMERIGFNYEELKQELVEKTDFYQHIVYTDDTIKTAKTDRADLNRLKKALNDKRLEVQREILKPFDDFKAKIDELISYINKSVENVDSQVKAYEAKVKEEKEHAIRAKFDELNTLDWLVFDQIFDTKWLNASASMGAIESEMKLILSGIEANVNSLKGVEYEFEATERYKTTLSLADALNENKRLIDLAFKKAEAEAKAKDVVKVADDIKLFDGAARQEAIKETSVIEVARVEEPVEDKEWMTLKVQINSKQYDDLEQFLNDRGIEWRME